MNMLATKTGVPYDTDKYGTGSRQQRFEILKLRRYSTRPIPFSNYAVLGVTKACCEVSDLKPPSRSVREGNYVPACRQARGWASLGARSEFFVFGRQRVHSMLALKTCGTRGISVADECVRSTGLGSRSLPKVRSAC